MRIRTATLVAAVAAAAATLTGCPGKDCSQQTPPIAAVPNCTAEAGTQVNIPLHVCPRCDQEPATCTVDMANANPAGGDKIELVPLSAVCDASSSCPIVDPASCPAAAVNCAITVPNTPGVTYDVVVIDPNGNQLPVKTLTVGPAYACLF